jgi:hypothetical protein
MSQPALRPLAAWYYQQIRPLAELPPGDGALGWPLAHFCAAYWAPVEDVADLFADGEDGTPGWAKLVQVETCPPGQLPWLGQFNGTVVVPGTAEATARLEVSQTRGQNRGGIDGLIADVKSTLTGTKQVRVLERDTGIHHLTVITRTAETPDSAKTLAAARAPARKRIGLLIDILVSDAPVWDEATLTWDAVSAGVTWDTVTTGTI